MPATIKIKNSSTAGAAPTASDLVQGELAVNVTDKRLYTENSGGTIVELGTNPSIPVTFPDGSASAPSLTNSGDTNTGIFFPAADTIAFAEGGTESMRLDSSGNLGLGVTPSAWYSTYKGLDVNAWGGLGASSTLVGLYGNAYFSSAANYKYKTSAAATMYLQDGTHSWHVAASGTAGNAITFTQAMTLDASGNLLVGATSATYSSSGRGLVEINGSSTSLLALKTGGSAAGYVYHDGTALSVVNTKASYIQFTTNSIDAARIDSSGYSKFSNNGSYTNLSGNYHELNNNASNWVCIARNSNATPSGIDSYFSAAAPNGTGNFFYYAEDSSAQRFAVRSNGGIANYSANNVNLSDRREKTNFAPAGDYLAKICAIPVQTFNYIDQNLEEDNGLTLGVVAQDVQAVAPELVMESNWAKSDEEPKMRLSIYQTDLQYALMKCIQEQQALIASQSEIITQLQADVAALKG